MINFAEQSAKTLYNELLALAYKELIKEREEITARLAELPPHIEGNPSAEEQLVLYRKIQTENAHKISEQINFITNKAQEEGVNLNQDVMIDDDFVRLFADNFRNIRHLSDTLSDAPPIIKSVQTRLYTEVLFKLDKPEQEMQLQTLSVNNIQDMISQAILIYDNNKDDIDLNNQCQQLVEMGIYEIVRREGEKVENAPLQNHQQYQDVIRSLIAKLPDVKKSSIIDNISQYKDSQGSSIDDLLIFVEKKLKINRDNDISVDEKIDTITQRKALYHRLRFGQEDRREYAKKTEDNLGRDLFWARNIRDVELFTKSGVSDQMFASLAEQRYLKNDKLFKPAKSIITGKVTGKLSVLVKKKLESVLALLINDRKERKLFPRGDKTDQLRPQDRPAAIAAILRVFQSHANSPTVEIKDDEITVNLYHFAFDKTHAETILDIILASGGFGQTAYTMLRGFDADSSITDNIHSMTITGRALAEIEEKIAGPQVADEQKAIYKDALEAIKSEVHDQQITAITGLELDNSNEIILRKLLELRFISSVEGVKLPSAIKAAFKKMEEGQYIDALKTPDLETALDDVYDQLADIDQNQVAEHVKPIIIKSKILNESSRQRQEKLHALKAAFEDDTEASQKAAKISDLFLAEYQEMAPTLGLTAEDDARLTHEIRQMANEMVRLIDRTRQGAPALTEEEQNAYFSLIKQIAEQIAPESLNDVQFKVKHSSHAVKVVNQAGLERIIPVNLDGVNLPYSLIKPLNGEFIFSYGGTRGVIAPFEGLDSAYAGEGQKKGRLFTHSRLLGVGQYGSVKEVESLLTGLNQVIKQGYLPADDATPTFKEASRNDLRTRPITARDDPLYRIESDILQNLSKAQNAGKAGVSGSTQYWIENDKPRQSGGLYAKDSTPKRYQILTERAKGDTFADTANRELNQYIKAEIAYHNPVARPDVELSDLNDYLALSGAIVREAQKFEDLGFGHNDIKPENFLYKRNSDGSYEVRYIDWATGGFKQIYQGNKSNLHAIFGELFGRDLPADVQGSRCVDKNGRFVQENADGVITYGVNPTLQILHGARNGTLPYISPATLGPDRSLKAVAGGVIDPHLDTKLDTSDSTQDNWALTAMTFGVCNRQAYFALIKGRAVGDYVVPGILETDGEEPLGLKIINAQKFNEFFACGDDVVSNELLASGEVYDKKDAVMFIPSNQREGEPLHLYRRLEKLKQTLQHENKDADSPEAQISKEIDSILAAVRQVVSTGIGFSKEALKDTLNSAERCIKNYEKLNDEAFQQTALKSDILETIFAENLSTADDLLIKTGGVSRLEALCTFPVNREQEEKASTILDKTIDAAQLRDKFLEKNAPGAHLFKECITESQDKILLTLLAKITDENPEFIALVKNEGLLHYAAQEGRTDVFDTLVATLKRAGASNIELFELMLNEYGPGAHHLHGAPHIKWATNCFHIAIRNNNEQQLAIILNAMPAKNALNTDDVISKALHLCAVLGNKTLFNNIVRKYNALNPDTPLTAQKISTMLFPPDDTSPYHLFLSDEGTLDVIAWDELKENSEFAKDFLLIPPPETASYPALIAAKNGNFEGGRRLITLGEDLNLSPEEWRQFFTQNDGEGKNLLNYMLEQGQIESDLPGFMALIAKNTGEDNADVLVYLMSNPHPVNPLQNFLNTPVSSAQQFEVVSTLLNAICSDFKEATPKQQEARIVALLINKDWLIEKAMSAQNQGELRRLLQNKALSIPFKRYLFEQLQITAPVSSLAHEFYTTLHDEIAPANVEKSAPVLLEISEIMQEVARQSNDLNGFITAMLSVNREVTTQLQAQVTNLESSIAAYSGELAATEKELINQLKETKKVRKVLNGTREQLEKATNQLEDLEEQIIALTTTSRVREEALEQAVKNAVSKGIEAEQEASLALALTKTHHQEVMTALEGELSKVRTTTTELMHELTLQKRQLAEKENIVSSLNRQLEVLGNDYQQLNQTLEEFKVLSAADKEHLESALATQNSARSSAEQTIQFISGQLSEIQKERNALALQAQHLEAANQELSTKITTLDSQIASNQNELTQLKDALTSQEQVVKETRATLDSTRQQLVKALQASSDLEDKIEDLTEASSAREKALQREIDEARVKGSEAQLKAEEVLAETKTQHEEAMKHLEAQLATVRTTTFKLNKKFGKQKTHLEEEQEMVASLGRKLDKAADEITRLTKVLVKSESLNEKEKARLQKELSAQAEALTTSEQRAEVLSEQLVEMTDTRRQLEELTQQLTSTNKILSSKVSTLESQLETYQGDFAQLNEKLILEQQLAEKTRATLDSTTQQLEQATVTSQALQSEIEALIAASSAREEALQREIDATVVKGGEAQRKAQEMMAEAQGMHQEAMQRLEADLAQVRATTLELSQDLGNQKIQLDEKRKALAALRSELENSGDENTRLTKALAESQSLRQQEKEQLQQALSVQAKALIASEQRASNLSGQLEEMVDVRSRLEADAQQLASTNKTLFSRVSSLESQLETQTSELIQLTSELASQQQMAQQASLKLAQTKEQLQAAEEAVEGLEQDLDELQTTYSEEVETLKENINAAELKGKKALHQAEERLAETQLSHEKAIKHVEKQLNKVQDKAENLQRNVDEQQSQLEEKQSAINNLGSQLESLADKNKRLNQDIENSQRFSEKEKAALQIELTQQNEARAALEQEVQIMSEKLSEVIESKSSLGTHVQTLESTNDALLEQVALLSRQIEFHKNDLAASKAETLVQQALVEETRAEVEKLEGLQMGTLLQLAEHNANSALQEQERLALLSRQSLAVEEVIEDAPVSPIIEEVPVNDAIEEPFLEEDVEEDIEVENVPEVPVNRINFKDRLKNLHESEEFAKTLVKTINNPEILKEIANVSARDDLIDALQNAGIENERIELLDDDARIVSFISNAAQNKLRAHQEAVSSLVVEISQSKDAELLAIIQSAKTKKEVFVKTEFGGLSTKLSSDLLDNNEVVKEITEQADTRFKDLMTRRQMAQEAILSTKTNWESLQKTDRALLKEPMKSIEPLKTMRRELIYLSQTPLVWLSPAFQASAKKYAAQITAHINELAENSNLITPYLQKQRCELIELLAGLPTNSQLTGKPYKAEVNKHREVLTRYLKNVEAELRIHMPVQNLLNGNEESSSPLRQQGLLKTLQQARDEQKDIRFLSFTSNYKDYSVSEKARHFATDWKDDEVKLGKKTFMEAKGGDSPFYKMVDRVKAGEFREHSIGRDKTILGRFIEERVPDSANSKEENIRLTVNTFPDIRDNDACIQYSMAMASQLLLGMKGKPSADNPVVLQGADPETLKYLWTALMVLGDSVPHMKFNHRAIKVVSSAYDPDVEMSTLSRYSNNSCYKTKFHNSPVLKKIQADLKEIMSDKLGHTDDQQKLKQFSMHVSAVFKEKMKDTLSKIEKENAKDGPQVPPRIRDR
ncbi:MAG: hypothetical protein Q8M03_16680 [Legionella sp.]|nr:hypothetical protein [Legionella sp.]